MPRHIAGSPILLCLAFSVIATCAPTAMSADKTNSSEPAWQPAAGNAAIQFTGRQKRNNPSQLLAAVSASQIFPERNIGIQCQDVNATLLDVSGGAVFARGIKGDRPQRFGNADWNGQKVLKLELNGHDAVKEGNSSRCELAIYPMPGSALPEDSTFWYSMNFLLSDWTGTTDEQIILQMHADDPRRISLNPFLAIVVKGNQMRTEVRWNSDDPPSKERSQVRTFGTNTIPMQSWVNITIKARISNQVKDDSFVTVWLNGEAIASYQGPIGYRNPKKNLNYVKAGLYHWTNGNSWDMKNPKRYMLLGSMALLTDPSEKFELPEIRNFATELMQ